MFDLTGVGEVFGADPECHLVEEQYYSARRRILKASYSPGFYNPVIPKGNDVQAWISFFSRKNAEEQRR